MGQGLSLEPLPPELWAYTLGGYPVLSKGLGYRTNTVLTLEDALWLTGTVQRIAALLGLGAKLDSYSRSFSELNA